MFAIYLLLDLLTVVFFFLGPVRLKKKLNTLISEKNVKFRQPQICLIILGNEDLKIFRSVMDNFQKLLRVNI